MPKGNRKVLSRLSIVHKDYLASVPYLPGIRNEERPSCLSLAVLLFLHSWRLPLLGFGVCRLVFRLHGVLSDCRQKGAASFRNRDLATQNGLKRYHLPK